MRQTGSICRPRYRSRRGLASLGATALLTALCVQPARAEPTGRRIAIEAGSAVRIDVHPAYVTVLEFPSPIVRVIRSDATHFTVEATDRRVFLRPRTAATPGTVANLHVVTEQSLVTVLLHVAEQPADAATHISFTDGPVPRRTPSPHRALALAAAGVFGSVMLDDGNRLFVGGMEASMEHPRSATRSLVALVAVTRAWFGPVTTEPMDQELPNIDVTAMATVHTVRLLGGYRAQRGQQLRAHATLLAGVQHWWLHERIRILDEPPEQILDGPPEQMVESWRSRSYTDGVAGVDVGLGITLWPRWHAGLGVRALRAWGIDASGYGSVEGWLSLQWL